MIGPTNALTVTGTVDPGSVTVGSDLKPVKLVNGVATAVANDLVSTTGNQTIGGHKTYTGIVTVNKSYYTYMDDRLPTNRNTYGSATGVTMPVLIHAVNQIGNPIAGMDFEETTSSRCVGFRLYGANGVGWNRAIMVNDSSGIYVTAPRRTYNANNKNDVVTIEALQASTDVVHRSGAENIAGDKTFTDALIKSGSKDNTFITLQNTFFDYPTAANQEPVLRVTDSNGNIIGQLCIRQNANGTHVLRIVLRNSDQSTYKTIELASSD